MSEVSKFLAGITGFAIVVTIFTSEQSPRVFTSIGNMVGNIYRGAGAAGRGR